MGNTLKIRKSKYLSYQKQGFLYLVFILFLFFSQAGGVRDALHASGKDAEGAERLP